MKQHGDSEFLRPPSGDLGIGEFLESSGRRVDIGDTVQTPSTNISMDTQTFTRNMKRKRETVGMGNIESSTLGSLPPTKRRIYNVRSDILQSIIQSIESYTTSGLDSITRGGGFKPFWNSQCRAVSENLWLPTGIDSRGLVQTSSSGSSIGMGGGLSISIRQRDPTPPKWTSRRISSQSSPSSPVESKDRDDITVLRNMKVRVYPTGPQRKWLIKTMHALRALRNEAIAQVNVGNVKPSELRKRMVSTKDRKCEFVTPETKHKWDAIDAVPATFRKNAMRKLMGEYTENFKRLRERSLTHFKMRFSSRKNKLGRVNIPLESQAFNRAKPFDDNFIYMFSRTPIGVDDEDKVIKFTRLKYKMDGSKKRRKKLPDPRAHDCQLVYEHPGRWYLLIPYDKAIKKTPAPYKDITMDPGTRSFQNFYSNDAGIAGTIDLCDRKTLLAKLVSKIRHYQSKRDGAKTRNESKFWSRRYNMGWSKLKNKTKDLHWKTIRFLVDNFEEIRVGDMGSEFIKRNKKMNKGVKNELSFLSHYSFRQRLLQQTAVRTIAVVAESFTSKTCCRCGVINDTLGSNKVFSCGSCGNVIDRDTNGAINIYIKDIVGLGQQV